MFKSKKSSENSKVFKAQPGQYSVEKSKEQAKAINEERSKKKELEHKLNYECPFFAYAYFTDGNIINLYLICTHTTKI